MMVKQLREQDRVSIVVFRGMLGRSGRVSGSDKERIDSTIKKLKLAGLQQAALASSLHIRLPRNISSKTATTELSFAPTATSMLA